MSALQISPRFDRRSATATSNPQSFIAYAPRGAGLLCALVYAARGDSVYGWWIGRVDGEYRPSFFALENYFSRKETGFYVSNGSDLYGGWIRDYDSKHPVLDAPVAVDPGLAHELEHVQYVFVQEWLSFSGEDGAAAEEARYHDAELAHQDVNVKFHRLNRLDKHHPVWVHRSAGFDSHILRRLARSWPLERWAIEA